MNSSWCVFWVGKPGQGCSLLLLLVLVSFGGADYLPLYSTGYIQYLNEHTTFIELHTNLPPKTVSKDVVSFIKGNVSVVLEKLLQSPTNSSWEKVKTMVTSEFAISMDGRTDWNVTAGAFNRNKKSYNPDASWELVQYELQEEEIHEFDLVIMKLDLSLPLRVRTVATVDNSAEVDILIGYELMEWERLGRSQMWFALVLMLMTYVVLVVDKFPRLLVVTVATAVLLVFLAVLGKFPSVSDVVAMVDAETIMVLFGMMVLMGTFSKTGLFEWLAVKCFQISHGRLWLLAIIISLATGGISMVLPNVTTIMLMAPVSLKISPIPFLVSSALFSNIGGTATLIGDPPNILIGSMVGISFTDFLANVMPGVLIIAIFATPFITFFYRHEWAIRKPVDIEHLAKEYVIKDKPLLIKMMITISVVLVLFISGSFYGLSAGWVALIGSGMILILTHPIGSLEEPLKYVEWETLLFYITLFSMIGCVESLGLIRWIANQIYAIIMKADEEARFPIAIVVLLWASGLASSFIDNTTYARMVIPVIKILSSKLNISVKILGYALSFGGCLGGNSTLIGAAANIVAASIAKQNNAIITFASFSQVGAPMMVLSVSISTAYMLLRYCDNNVRRVIGPVAAALILLGVAAVIIVLFIEKKIRRMKEVNCHQLLLLNQAQDKKASTSAIEMSTISVVDTTSSKKHKHHKHVLTEDTGTEECSSSVPDEHRHRHHHHHSDTEVAHVEHAEIEITSIQSPSESSKQEDNKHSDSDSDSNQKDSIQHPVEELKESRTNSYHKHKHHHHSSEIPEGTTTPENVSQARD